MASGEPSQDERRRRVATIVAIGACVLVAILPFFFVTDVPGVDQPNHMATVAAWNHFDDPSYGLQAAYVKDIRPDPYFAYYGFVHYASYVMPIRWANKLFHFASVIVLALGMLAFLRAHRRPEALALVALPLAWNYNMAAGFISTIFGFGVLLYALSLIARVEDARPWPSTRLWIGNALIGFALYLSHFLAWTLWAPIVLLRLRLRGLLLLLPSAPLFLIQSDRPSGKRFEISAKWLRNEVPDFPDLLFDYMSKSEKAVLIAGLLIAWILAWRFIQRDADRDRRPLFLFAFLTVLFFALPFALYQPFYWSNINVRIPPLAFLILFACLPRGRLEGRRALYVAAPIIGVLVLHMIWVIPRWMGYERRSRDFYAVVKDLPRNPDVYVLMTDTQDPIRRNLWKEQGSYIGVDKGGLRYSGWLRGFPLRLRDGAKPRLKLEITKPDQYQWVVVRDTKAKRRKLEGFEIRKQQGMWTLWERVATGSGSGAPR